MILKTELQTAPLDLVTAVIEKANATFADMGATISVTGDFDAFQAVDRDGALVFGGYNPGITNATRGVSVVVSVDSVAVATGATNDDRIHLNADAWRDARWQDVAVGQRPGIRNRIRRDQDPGGVRNGLRIDSALLSGNRLASHGQASVGGDPSR